MTYVVYKIYKDTIISRATEFFNTLYSSSLSQSISPIGHRILSTPNINCHVEYTVELQSAVDSPRSPEDLEIIGRSSTMYGLEPSTMLLRDIIFYYASFK